MIERQMCKTEFKGILNATIPLFDTYGPYNDKGLAIVEKDGKLGVVNNKPEIVVPAEFESIKILENGVIILGHTALYSLVDKFGLEITNRCFASLSEAEGYGIWF